MQERVDRLAAEQEDVSDGEQNSSSKRSTGWLAPGHFDAVVDFAKTIADPQDPSRIAPQFDSGDHLHPSPAGYKAMGDSIPLTLFDNPRR